MRTQEQLVKRAIDFLKNEGFEDSEIQTEYRLETEELGNIFIDVVCINNEKKIAIECGHLQRPRIIRTKVLKNYFDTFIHFRFNRYFVYKGKITKEKLNKLYFKTNYLPTIRVEKNQLEWLDLICNILKMSRCEAMREAMDEWASSRMMKLKIKRIFFEEE